MHIYDFMEAPGTLGFGPDIFGSSGTTWTTGDWMSIINRGFDVGSQAIAAWGRNPSQQVGYSGTVGIGQGYSPAASLQYQAALAQARAYQNNNPQGAGNLGSTVGGGIDGVIDWATRNPIPVFLGIAGVFLLFRQPPGRR